MHAGIGALKEKLGLNHIERSGFVESTNAGVHRNSSRQSMTRRFVSSCARPVRANARHVPPPPAPLECPCDPHSGCSSVPPARAFRKREGDICVVP